MHLIFMVQSRLVTILQNAVEEASYAFIRREMPDILQSNSWDSPQAASLSQMLGAIQSLDCSHGGGGALRRGGRSLSMDIFETAKPVREHFAMLMEAMRECDSYVDSLKVESGSKAI